MKQSLAMIFLKAGICVGSKCDIKVSNQFDKPGTHFCIQYSYKTPSEQIYAIGWLIKDDMYSTAFIAEVTNNEEWIFDERWSVAKKPVG